MTQVTNEMIAAAWAAWKPRHRERLGPGPAFVEAIQAALDVMPSRSFHVGPIGPGEVTGPVYVNHIPYVPASEVERLRAENTRLKEALEWYSEPVLAYAITQANEPRSAVHADRGRRARIALGTEPTI